jgi:NADP-dependent 3-hydroxy acid dehydrogenase YdfG
VLRGINEDTATLSTEDYRTMMGTNVDGAFFMTRAALPHLTDSHGHLVYIGSFAGRFPRSFHPVYAATKWWLRGFAGSVEASVGAHDVAVSIINTGEVRTNLGTAEGTPWKERYDEDEAPSPDEIAKSVVFAVDQDLTVSELNIHPRDKLGESF